MVHASDSLSFVRPARKIRSGGRAGTDGLRLDWQAEPVIMAKWYYILSLRSVEHEIGRTCFYAKTYKVGARSQKFLNKTQKNES